MVLTRTIGGEIQEEPADRFVSPTIGGTFFQNLLDCRFQSTSSNFTLGSCPVDQTRFHFGLVHREGHKNPGVVTSESRRGQEFCIAQCLTARS